MTGQFPFLDMTAFATMQEKNFEAFVEANKIAMAGYQDLAKRQAGMFEKNLADVTKKVGAFKPEPMTAETATAAANDLKAAMEQASGEAKDLFEAAQKTNEAVFGVLKTRADKAAIEAKELMAA